jgi:hypothetical protein
VGGDRGAAADPPPAALVNNVHAADTLQEVIAAAERGIQRIRATHWLAYSFLRHCGLLLW